MATQEYAASIQGVSIRVTRLDAAGNLLTGAGDSYTTSAFMRVSFTPEYEEGDEITEKGANGVVCVSYKAPDTLKRITMELAICEPDPELSALISGGLLLRKDLTNGGATNVKSIGWAAPGVGDDPAGNGVAIEAWSHAVSGGKRASVLPYFHWVFPYVKMRQSGDRVIENGLMANTFEGYGLGNANFGSGIDGRWEFPVAAERPYAYARTSWAPTGLSGFYTWSDNSTDQVVFTAAGALNASSVTLSKAGLSSNVATLKFSGNPELEVGDKIAVGNVSTPFNGSFTLTGYEQATFANAEANVNSVIYKGTSLDVEAGDVITVTGYAASRFNLTEATVTSANATTVVVNNSGLEVTLESAVGTANLVNKVTYASTADDVATFSVPTSARVRVLNSVTENRIAAVPVSTLSDTVTGESYNVPGNLTYNADNAIDNIIIANETGTTSAN